MAEYKGELLSLHRELVAEEQRGTVNGLSEVALRRGKREELGSWLASLEREVRHLRRRFERLPPLPELMCVRWAQSVLACRNGRILVVDTLGEVASLLHVLLLDFCGGVCFERYVPLGGGLTGQAKVSRNMTAQDLQEAASPAQFWRSLEEALAGQYVLSYDLECARRALELLSEQFELDPLPIIGDCLLRPCQRYFREWGFVELSSLCALVGHPLPAPSDCTALDRARGQLHLLRCMARGIAAAPGGAGGRAVTNNECGDQEML